MRIFKYNNEELTLNKIQKKHFKQINLTLIMLFLFNQNLYAEDSKFSVGLSFSSSNINISDTPGLSNGNGGKLDLDYKINSLFTLQLSYLDLDSTQRTFDFDPTTNSNNISKIQTNLDVNGYGLSLLANHEWDKIFVYGKLGVLSSTLKFGSITTIGNETLLSSNPPSDTSNKVSYGFGTGYKLSSNFDVVLDYSRSQIATSSLGDPDIETISLGLRYNF